MELNSKTDEKPALENVNEECDKKIVESMSQAGENIKNNNGNTNSKSEQISEIEGNSSSVTQTKQNSDRNVCEKDETNTKQNNEIKSDDLINKRDSNKFDSSKVETNQKNNTNTSDNKTTSEQSINSILKVENSNDPDIISEAKEIDGEKDVEYDVPDDFFDDFLKQDFMEGLDIVDDDDVSENEKNRLVTESKEQSKETKTTPKKTETKSKERDKSSKSNSEEKRRDPEKTKRDIQNYKMKCMKDQQRKLLTERLDSGLVPPGMEMEVDSDVNISLKEDKKEQSKSDTEDPPSKRRKVRQSPVRKHSPIRNPSPMHKRNPLRKTSPLRKVSPLRKTSPLRKRYFSPTRLRGNVRPSPDRRMSPLRRRVSPMRRDSSHYTNKSPDELKRGRSSQSGRRSHERRKSHSRSPRRRSRSSDRRGYRDRRSRRSSPKRRKTKYGEKSFLEEIAEKLNETRPMMPMAPMYQGGVQAPIPAPVMYPVVQPTYDQQFFIGNTNLPATSHVPGSVNQQVQPMTRMTVLQAPPVIPMTQPYMMEQPVVPPVPNLQTVPTVPQEVQTPKQPEPEQEIDEQEQLAKLFEEKKISLSEYLSRASNTKVQSTSPESLKEKVQVISMCHDAIKFLDNGKKYIGRLSVKPTKEQPPVPVSIKNKSPLLRSSRIRFPFTKPPANVPPGKEFSSSMERLLQCVGLSTRAVALEPVPQEKKEEAAVARKSIDNARNVLPKMVQTDPYRCENCEIRKRKSFNAISVQCGEPVIKMVSVETQVCEEDLMPKKKSLAALTPAQLLGKIQETNTFNPPVRDTQRGPPPRTFQTFNPMPQSSMNPYGCGYRPRYKRM
ncbi:serine/arginine repetitive matrix protein 2 isoform X2 [Aethina tumida]|uniref:serine/arginine repetitive matrix protein 2 isoform X2 n=1 Tax=Aethina tumida TaxID=116153 RepID=UPI002147987C|nr:serine/arginine repetitive matrix protein 2 isoform X2 [Aethina tumida]